MFGGCGPGFPCSFSPPLCPHLGDIRIIYVAPTDVQVRRIGPRGDSILDKTRHCCFDLIFSLCCLPCIVLIVQRTLRDECIELLKCQALRFERSGVRNTRDELVYESERLFTFRYVRKRCRREKRDLRVDYLLREGGRSSNLYLEAMLTCVFARLR